MHNATELISKRGILVLLNGKKVIDLKEDNFQRTENYSKKYNTH